MVIEIGVKGGGRVGETMVFYFYSFTPVCLGIYDSNSLYFVRFNGYVKKTLNECIIN